jgi:hypothetical protein
MFEEVLKEINFSASTHTGDKLLQEICAIVQTHLQLVFVGIFLLDKTKELIRFRAGSGEVGRIMFEHGHYFPLGTNSFTERSILLGDIWLICQPTAQIFKCNLSSKGKSELDSPVDIHEVTNKEKRLPHPLIPGKWQLSIPLQTQRGRFGALWIYHEEDVLNVPVEMSTVYLQKLADEIALQISEWGFATSYLP